VSISDGLLGLGVNNNVFEAMNKTRTDILHKIEAQGESGHEQATQIMELMRQMFVDQ
jgi:hypothetical protein